MADKIAVLRAGRIEQFGRPLDLYNRPANIFVAGFIGSPKMNFIAGEIDAQDPGLLRLGSGETVQLPRSGFGQRRGMKVTIGVRPTHLRPEAGGAISIDVDSVEQLGGESYIYGRTSGGAPITVHSPGQTEVRPGSGIALNIPTAALHLFDTETGVSLRLEEEAEAELESA